MRLAGAGQPNELVAVHRLAVYKGGLELFGFERQRRGLPYQPTLDFAERAADLFLESIDQVTETTR
jgi:hypothetical protein